MVSAATVASLVLVSLVWGGTNPFVRAGVERVAYPPATGRWAVDAPAQLAATFADWRFVLPFAVNQCGSVLYTALLASVPVSLALPVVNSLTAVFTFLTAYFVLGERERVSLASAAGAALVIAGVAVCAAAS